MTVSSGEGTASTSGAVTIRSVNGGEAGSSGVLLFSSVEKIQVERSYFIPHHQGTPSELGASLPEPAAMYNNKKRPNELESQERRSLTFPIKLSSAASLHTPHSSTLFRMNASPRLVSDDL